MSNDDLDDLLSEPNRRGVRPGMPVDPGRLLLSVKRDWRWIPLAAAIWAALGLLVAFLFITHTFLAQTTLIWEPNREDNANPDPKLLFTEGGAMKLPGTIRKVRQKLKLGIPVDALQKQIDVKFESSSNLVTVEAGGPTARDAAVLANTIVQVFLADQTDIVRARAEESQRALDKDIKVAQSKLEAARTAYDAFRTENAVSDIETETRDALAYLAKLKSDQQQFRADLENFSSQVTALQEQQKREPHAKVLPGSSATLAAAREELAVAMRRYSPADHPEITRLKAKVAALQASPGTGVVSDNPQYQSISTALSNAIAQRDGSAARLKSTEESIPNAEQRAGWYRSLQGPARAFLQEIELSEKRLVDQQARIARARDAARTPQVEWRVIQPAVEPEWPERSKRRWIVAGMPLLGMLVALIALLIRPLLDGRVYTAREAGYWANAPVLGSTTWPRNPDMLFTLADELTHHGALAPGYTLVVGATSREKPHAEELAYWLGGGASDRKREHPGSARVKVTAAPSGGVHSAGGGGGAATTVLASEALVPVQRQAAAPLALYPQGTHAWLGGTDGPSLRRAARMADRVIVLLTSGAEVFTSVADLRTRLGREAGVGIVMLGLSSELLKLPDRVGNIDVFWSSKN